MPIPYVSFTEVDTGISALQPRVKNRIGIVGEFSRGPANIPTYITGYTDFAQRYGSDIAQGSLAFQAAYDQLIPENANFALVRVLGRGQSAKGSAIFLTGTTTKEVTLTLTLTFIGEVTEVTSNIYAQIVSSGTYTGTRIGRYHFKVTSVTANVATVKYTLKEITDGSSIDWDTVTTSISVDLAADAGLVKDIEDGVKLAFGVTGQTDDIELDLNDTFTVRVNSYSYPISLDKGLVVEQVLNIIIQEISGRGVIGAVTKNNNEDGFIFELDNGLEGRLGNRYKYNFVLDDNTAGLSVTPNTPTSMNGGLDGPRQSFRDFYNTEGEAVLRLQAVTEGIWGDGLEVSITSIEADRFRLLIQDTNASKFNPPLESESYILDFKSTDNNGELTQLRTSKYLRGFFLPKFNAVTSGTNNFAARLLNTLPTRLAPADTAIVDTDDPRHPSYFGSSKLRAIPLENGFDGPVITDEDYIQALRAFETFPVHIVMCAGRYDSFNVQTSLISHCERASELEGLRVGILTAPPNLTVERLRSEMLGIDSQRAIKVAGWCSYAGQPNAPAFAIPAAAFYAGKLSGTPYFASPSAVGLVGPVLGLVDVDTRGLSKKSLDLFEEAGYEILGLDPARLSYTFFTGRTTSKSPNWSKVYYRRTFDFVRQDLFLLLQDYKSRPHTQLLRAQIASSINNYFNELVRRAEIVNFKQAVIDGSNNSFDTYYANQLNVSISFLPLAAADFINVTLLRDNASGEIVFGG